MSHTSQCNHPEVGRLKGNVNDAVLDLTTMESYSDQNVPSFELTMMMNFAVLEQSLWPKP